MPLQRNSTDHPLDVPAASVTVEPGETLDWPVPVVGFEPADEQETADDGPDDEKPADPAPPKTPRKRAAGPADTEEAAG